MPPVIGHFHTYFQDRFIEGDNAENPDTSNWAVNALAPAVADGTNPAEVARALDDTTEEGFGGSFFIPENCARLELTAIYWPNVAPGAARTAGWKLYARAVSNNVAIGAWQNVVLTDLAIPTNRNPQYQTQIINLTAFATALVPGTLYKFQFTRPAPTGGTNLTGDLYVRGVRVRALATAASGLQ